MRPKLLISGPGTLAEVRDAFKAEKNVKHRQKLQVIRLGFTGVHTSAEIAEIAGCCKASVTNWVRDFREGGIANLLKTNYETVGRKPSLDEEVCGQLIEGLRAGRWKRMKEMRKWLSCEHGIELSNGGMQYWLIKVGASLKVPRKSHVKKIESQSQEFKEGLAKKLEHLELDTNKAFRLWVVDEHRYGLISVLRRCWTLRGVRPTSPYQTKYQWGYVYGGLEVTTGKCEFLYTPTVTLEISNAFLKQISKSDPDAEHVIIWDGAGFHQRKKLENIPRNIHLIRLPPYSPELNPIEQLWDQVAVVYANNVYETLTEIEKDITIGLKPFWENSKKVLSLLGVDNYLNLSANNI